MKDIKRLTDLEIKIMCVLWDHDQNLTIQEIAGYLEKDSISAASVTQAMQKLVAKKSVAVKEHVLISSVYARAFRPCYTKEEFLASEFKRLEKSVFGSKKMNVVGIAASLLENEDNKGITSSEIDELQRIIDSKKKKLK